MPDSNENEPGPNARRAFPPLEADAYRDISRRIETGMPTFPGDPPVALSTAATIDTDDVSVHELRCGSHTGTHIDAPSHTEPDGDDLGDRSVGDYVFDAGFCDVSPCSPRQPIDAGSLPDSDELASVDILVIRTGWDTHWTTDRYVDHPYLAPPAARRLRAAGCGVALDTLNPDPTRAETAPADEPAGVPVHHLLLGAGLPIIENLARLAGLPERFVLYAFPLPLASADGAPVRAVAFVG